MTDDDATAFEPEVWTEVECACLDRHRVPTAWVAFRCHTCRRLWTLTEDGWTMRPRWIEEARA